jgi:hypothetical protein
MDFPRRILTAALFALLALPLAASAQTAAPVKLAVGTWTGTVTPPNEPQPMNITYEVSYKADTLAITLVAGDHGSFPLNELEVTDTKISFSFTPGPKVVCALAAKDGGYAGDCTDDGGNVVPMTMTPPAKDPKS